MFRSNRGNNIQERMDVKKSKIQNRDITKNTHFFTPHLGADLLAIQ